MAKKSRPGRKVRVDFKQNRSRPRRETDLTRRYRTDDHNLADHESHESVRAKGALSRKRTVVVDEDAQFIVDPANWHSGVVVTVHGQYCFVDAGEGAPVTCSVRRVLRTMLIEQRSVVTVGDRVWFTPIEHDREGKRTGVIVKVEPRTSELGRGARVGHDQRREGHLRRHVIAANIDQLLIVASALRPAFKPHLIDRYLVAAIRGNLRPILCVNKWDLIESMRDVAADGGGTVDATRHDTAAERAERKRGEEPALPARGAGEARSDRIGPASIAPDDSDSGDAIDYDDEALIANADIIEEWLGEFEDLGYRCIRVSAVRGDGIDALRAELRGRTTVLSGQSGVGKSSLLNRIQPGLRLTVAEVSADNDKGRHTTTHARLLKLDAGGYVVDTPGIRTFDVWDVAPGELESCFVEFAPLIAQCRFRDCHHVDEDGCAVRDAADKCRISPRRYGSYLKLLDELAGNR